MSSPKLSQLFTRASVALQPLLHFYGGYAEDVFLLISLLMSLFASLGTSRSPICILSGSTHLILSFLNPHYVNNMVTLIAVPVAWFLMPIPNIPSSCDSYITYALCYFHFQNRPILLIMTFTPLSRNCRFPHPMYK